MPGLDYANGVPLSTGTFGGAARAKYGNAPGWERVRCPDCGQWADKSLGGDHGGQCLDDTHVIPPNSAVGIIRRYAQANARFSAEDIRAELDAHDVKPSARGPAFGVAQRKGYIEPDGFERSTGESAKGAHLQTYRSLIFEPRKATP